MCKAQEHGPGPPPAQLHAGCFASGPEGIAPGGLLAIGNHTAHSSERDYRGGLYNCALTLLFR